MTKLLCAGDKCFIPGEVYEVSEDGLLHVRFEAAGSKGFHFWFKPEQLIEDPMPKVDIEWCDAHKPQPGGKRTCPFCTIRSYAWGLSEVDKLIDVHNGQDVHDPNYASGFECFYSPEAVVDRLRKVLPRTKACEHELRFIKSYLSHHDQDASHEFIVRRINAVLLGKDPDPLVSAALREMNLNVEPEVQSAAAVNPPDAAELAGFLSGLDEVENCIAFLERAGTGEEFTHGYNQALGDVKKFIKKQKGFTSKDVLDYETRSSDGERVRKDRWETAIRNIAHLFFGSRGAWEISEVVERVENLKQHDDAFKQAFARPSVEDETPVAEELKYGRTAGMNRAPDDIPNPNRAAWLRNEVSSFGQTKIYQPQYEELRVHAVNLWNRLKTIKEAIKS